VLHPLGSNHVQIQSLIDGTLKTINCEDLRIFTGSHEEAVQLAQVDKGQHVVKDIIGHVGAVEKRSRMEFLVRYTDGAELWHSWSKDITDTMAFKAYCKQEPWLELLLVSAADAKVTINHCKNRPIPTKLCGRSFFMPLRYLFSELWYDCRQQLPDHHKTRYYVEAKYGIHPVGNVKAITVAVPALNDPKLGEAGWEFDSALVHFFGSKTELHGGDILLGKDEVKKYQLLSDDKGTTHKMISPK